MTWWLSSDMQKNFLIGFQSNKAVNFAIFLSKFVGNSGLSFGTIPSNSQNFGANFEVYALRVVLYTPDRKNQFWGILSRIFPFWDFWAINRAITSQYLSHENRYAFKSVMTFLRIPPNSCENGSNLKVYPLPFSFIPPWYKTFNLGHFRGYFAGIAV